MQEPTQDQFKLRPKIMEELTSNKPVENNCLRLSVYSICFSFSQYTKRRDLVIQWGCLSSINGSKSKCLSRLSVAFRFALKKQGTTSDDSSCRGICRKRRLCKQCFTENIWFSWILKYFLASAKATNITIHRTHLIYFNIKNRLPLLNQFFKMNYSSWKHTF